MKKNYPEWVNKHHTKGTSIKQIGDNYYLYSVTSKYSKEKGYPVSIQHYIGKITKEGLIEPEKISFIPLKDKLTLLKDAFPLNQYNKEDYTAIATLPLLISNGNYYTGVLSKKTEKILLKHLNYKDGIIYGQL